MCPNAEFFLVGVFTHSDWIRRDMKYLSVFSPNAGKYRPEKTPYLDTFHAMYFLTKKTIMSSKYDNRRHFCNVKWKTTFLAIGNATGLD